MKRTSIFLRMFAAGVALMIGNSESAWAVVPPVVVEPAYTTDWVAPEDGGIYFLYNVGADQYLGVGNNWGTHVVTATVSDESMAEVYFWDASIALSGSSSDMNVCLGVLPVKLTKAEDGSFYMEHMGSNRADCYLTSEDAAGGTMTNSWIDGGKSRAATFNIVAVEGGYTIQATNTVEAGTFFGAADIEVEPEEGMDAVRNVMNNLTEGQNIIWRFAPTNYVQCMAYEVRLEFYDKIVEAEEEGVSTSAAEAVYNNPNATVDEIKAAINALTVAINKQKFETLLAGATNDDPIDATEFVLVNPDFEEGNISGWTTNYVSGQQANNIGYQSATYTNGDVTISRFIEAWKSNSNPWTIGDGYLQQTVFGLPAGKYMFEVDAISTYQWSNTAGKNPAEGVFIFIESGENEAKTAIATGNEKPEHFTVSFVNPKGSDALTFGLKTESATANWIAADNFRIWYYGETELTPAQAELELAIKEAKSIDTNMPANLTVIETLEQSISKAQELLDNSATDDECKLAIAHLAEAESAFYASVKEYEAFSDYFNYDGVINGIIEKILENSHWANLGTQVSNYQDALLDKYNNGTLSSEEISESQDKVHSMILEFLKGYKIQPGDKLSVLIQNADFSQGGGLDLTGNQIPGWTITNGSITELSTSYHNIEAYHRVFDLHQTIPFDLPAGTYRITLQGFVREDGSSNTAVLYAGSSERQFKLITDENSEEQICTDGTGSTSWPCDVFNPVLGGYQPNSMIGAKMYFETINPATEQPYYLNDVTVVHEGGELTIGIRCNSTGLWMLWDNFTLEYVDESILTSLLDDIALLGKTLEELQASEAGIPNEQTARQAINILEQIANAGNIQQEDEAQALKEQAQALILQIQQEQKDWYYNDVATRFGVDGKTLLKNEPVYLYNIKARQFITSGQTERRDDNCLAVLSEERLPLCFELTDTVQLAADGGTYEGIALISHDRAYDKTGVAQKFTQLALQKNYPELIFIHYNIMDFNLTIPVFRIQQSANGYYKFTSSVEGYGQYLGYDEQFYSSAYNTTMLSCNVPDTDDAATEWAIIPAKNAQTHVNAILTKLALQNLTEVYNEAYSMYSDDNELESALIKAADVVWKSGDIPLEEVETANKTLLAAMNHARFSDIVASPYNPADVTAAIRNADFNGGTAGGWVLEGLRSGVNGGYQSASYTNSDYGVTISQFIEAWLPNQLGSLSDGDISQMVYGLPAGTYTLEADVIASYQNGSNDMVNGVSLYMKNAASGAYTDVSTLNGQPQHFSLTFDHDGSNEVSLGLMLSGATANWVAADNFRLYYLGDGQTLSILGDANCDGSVDVVDVTTTVDFILQKSQPTDLQFQNTDVNKDQSIDVVDLTSIVSIILGTYQPTNGTNKAPALHLQNNDALLLNGTDIALRNSREYLAFQIDVTLADGAQLRGVQLSQRAEDHTVAYHMIGNNTYRILAYSLTGTPFTGSEGNLFSLNIAGGQEVTVSNILFTDGTAAYTLGLNIATGISTANADTRKAAVYDLQGRRINLKKDGVYIVNGKKVTIK